MNEVKNLSGISYIERPVKLSEWAKRVISSQNFTSDKIKSSETFREMSRSQKDAIRYQLKKQAKSKNVEINLQMDLFKPIELKRDSGSISKEKSFKNLKALGILKYSFCFGVIVFLMKDLVGFYQLKGLDQISSWMITILVEMGIVLGCLSSKKSLKFCAYLLFAYNLCVFSVYEIKKHKRQLAIELSQKAQILDGKKKVKALDEQITKERSFQSRQMRDLSLLFEKGIVSKGAAAVENMISKSASRVGVLEEKRDEHGDLSSRDLPEISKHDFWINVGLMLLLRFVLQVFSMQCLHSKRELGI